MASAPVSEACRPPISQGIKKQKCGELNLGLTPADSPENVKRNRELFVQALLTTADRKPKSRRNKTPSYDCFARSIPDWCIGYRRADEQSTAANLCAEMAGSRASRERCSASKPQTAFRSWLWTYASELSLRFMPGGEERCRELWSAASVACVPSLAANRVT